MTPWQVDGGVLGWRPYADLETMSNGKRPHTWMALPLDRSLLTERTLTIEVRPERALDISGDYRDDSASTFHGPALTPWFDGLSLWRWLANAHDPRITWPQPLGASYRSARLDGSRWRPDVSPARGGTPALYRIFVVQEIFGPQTNALGRSSMSVAPPSTRCRTGEGFPTTAVSTAPYLCNESATRLAFHTRAGIRIGSVSTSLLGPDAPQGAIVATLSDRATAVTVVHVAGPLFVANLVGTDGRLIYSLAFSYPAIPPAYG